MSSGAQIQDENLSRVFDVIDVTGDGLITAGDFTALAEGVAAQLAPGTDEHRRQHIVATYLNWWEQIRRDADADGDGQVSREEFIEATERGLEKDPEYLSGSLHKCAEAVFEALDRNGDGQIDETEYVALYASAKVDGDTARAAFGRIDENGDGVIDYPEFLSAVRELMSSADPDAPGAGLLG